MLQIETDLYLSISQKERWKQTHYAVVESCIIFLKSSVFFLPPRVYIYMCVCIYLYIYLCVCILAQSFIEYI